MGIENIETSGRTGVAFHNAMIASTVTRFLIRISNDLTDPFFGRHASGVTVKIIPWQVD